VDGIISTRTNIIKMAKEEGVFSIQRFFILDSHSIDTTLESLKSSKADMIEIMPGIIPKIIKRLKESVDIPIIAGGLIETKEEIKEILKSGAFAISTGKEELWK
jgi:glycerol uptake operon antiterminator